MSLLLAVMTGSNALTAQTADRVPQTIDSSRTIVLRNHRPLWANAANSVGVVPSNTPLNQLTLVLARSPQQEQDLELLLANQQNPASPEYHHWLTPSEFGERFGVSDADLAAIEGWLQSRGLHVNWVSPGRIFVGFGGTAADIGSAFGTELRYYGVNGAQRMSVAGDPVIPQALAPVISAVRGLFAIDEQPAVRITTVQTSGPELTATAGSHFVAPADFSSIYDMPAGTTGAGVTVGIVSWSRTNFVDFDNFRAKTGTIFANPTEIVPTGFGGIDPGPAYTTQQSCSSCLQGQMEATLDVQRVGGTAPGANILLVVSSSAGSGDGIGAAAQYLVNTSPVPAQVMSISFGGCELASGNSGVSYWDKTFQQAAAEGISVFVSSGDSGASGCDPSFVAPPSSPAPNSPNYICSSQYATCVGGTEFNDGSSPSTYWNSANGLGYLSVLGYIPEGGWNESSANSASASGGGVSTVIPTPSWQTGAGVPAARSGRYTPDLSFTASTHDGYFGCLAAGGGSCSGSPFSFVAFAGTSASAPGMAGVAAMLDQKLGGAQGNLNPALYGLAASNPAVFHDVTVTTSGVASCSVNTASMCNNSIPPPTGTTGGQAGYLVGTGYDEVTGLGSLDVSAFLNSLATSPKTTPTVIVSPSSTGINTAQTLTVTVTVSGGSGTPTGTVMLSSGTYTSSSVTLSSGSASINIAAGALPAGSDTLTVTYVPDAASWSIYNSTAGSNTVTVTALSKTTPTVIVSPSSTSINTTQTLTVVVTVSGGTGTPTGAVALSSGTYTSAPTALSSGSASISIAAGALSLGSDTLMVTYAPDAASSSLYNSAAGSSTIAVTSPPVGSFTLNGPAVSLTAGATTTTPITVTPANGFTGSVTLTANFTESPSGAGTVNLPTLSFGSTSPVSITSASQQTATLTITTTASQQGPCTASNEAPRGVDLYARGGGVLACVLLCGIGSRRRRFRASLGMVALLVALASGMVACSGAKVVSCTPTTITGTTAGSYTVTITGTSPTATASRTVTITVQ